jgi:hypothetical protein
LPSQRRGVRQPPFATRVLGRCSLDREAHAAGDLLECLLDARPLCEHGRAIGGTDVVQIDVYRQTRKSEDEQVEGGPSLERHPGSEEWMRANRLEQTHEHMGLLVQFDLKPAVRRCSLELFARQHHATSAQVR